MKKQFLTLRRAYSLIEVLIAISIITIIMVPAIGTIQGARLRSKSTSVNLMSENLAVTLMELVKNYNWSASPYGTSIGNVDVDAGASLNPLLNIPRSSAPGGGGTTQANMPAGPPGGASQSNFEQFLSDFRTGAKTMAQLGADSIITNNQNYYFYNRDQIAALNGYSSYAAWQTAMNALPANKRTPLLDSQIGWGFFVRAFTGYKNIDPAQDVADDMRHVAVIVKWRDPSKNPNQAASWQFTILESYQTTGVIRLSSSS